MLTYTLIHTPTNHTSILILLINVQTTAVIELSLTNNTYSEPKLGEPSTDLSVNSKSSTLAEVSQKDRAASFRANHHEIPYVPDRMTKKEANKLKKGYGLK